jgi:spore maturation protein A
MLNKIWFWLLLIGILYGLGKSAVQSWHLERGTAKVEPQERGPQERGPQERGRAEEDPALAGQRRELSHEELAREMGPLQATGKAMTDAALSAATLSVELCIGLIGVMALWLGMLNIAREAGLVDALARWLQPMMRWLFPEVPDGHPAQGAMLMNIAANMLGLDNAATPFGLKAMRELQTLNPTRDTATNAMATFLAINTSNVTLVPISIIGLRVAAGSTNAAEPLAGMLLTTSITTVVAIVAVRTLSKWPRYALPVSAKADAAAGLPGPLPKPDAQPPATKDDPPRSGEY